ncbi:MAG: hypothetical protein KDA60_01820 [Planctomycetales bacterium]|nr:hypothetical protein [Planctomycetales bacterium]
MRRLFVLAALLLAGCGGSDEADRSIGIPENPAPLPSESAVESKGQASLREQETGAVRTLDSR